MKTVAFARVSTQEQANEGFSLESQMRLIDRYADAIGIDITKRFEIPETASRSHERKAFRELLDYIKKHNVGIILCEKVDRLTRNFKDAVVLDDWIKEDADRQIHFIKQNLVVHKEAGSHVMFQWDIYLSLARQYSHNLSEETKKGLLEKAQSGWYPGNKKLGYKIVGQTGKRTWVIDKDSNAYKYIQRAFTLYADEELSIEYVSKILYEEGWENSNGKPISVSHLHKRLKDPFYSGRFIWKGKEYQGKHEPLISEELFERVQEKITRPIKAGKTRNHFFKFGGGLLVCGECGRTVTAEKQKGFHYYHCTQYKTDCTQDAYIREKYIEEQILALLDAIRIDDPVLLQWVATTLKENHKDEKDYIDSVLLNLDRQHTKLKNRLDAMYDDKLDGLITAEQYSDKKEKTQIKMKKIRKKKDKIVKDNINYLEIGYHIFELAQNGRSIYENKLEESEQRELLGFLFSNVKLKDGKLDPIYHNGFEVVAKYAENNQWRPREDSNL